MSAFMLSPSRVQAIAAGIVRFYENENPPKPMPRTSIALAETLYKLNTDAIHARYADRYGEIEPFEAGLCDKLDGAPLLKAIHCLLYQCSEGDVPETELFKALDKVATDIAYQIVSEMPEYRDAEWG